MLRKFIAAAVAAVGLMATAPMAQAQSYGNGPIRLIVGFSAGGPTDIFARTVADQLARRLEQSVVVENIPGGSGSIAAVEARQSEPDGQTIFMGGISTMGINPVLRDDLPYDAINDFEHLSLASRQPIVLLVHPDVPAQTLQEFIDYGKASGDIKFASSGFGGSGHVAGELFKLTTGLSMTHVGYKGAAPALIDLVGGHVKVMFGTPAAAVPHIREGALRALAITGAERSPALPDVPTFAEAGVSDYDASSWYGFTLPKGTPTDKIERLNAELKVVLEMPEVADRLAADGAVASWSTPADFHAFILDEQEKWRMVVEKTGMRAAKD